MGARRGSAGAVDGSADDGGSGATHRRVRGTHAVYLQSHAGAGCNGRSGRGGLRPRPRHVPRRIPDLRRRLVVPGRSTRAISRTRRSL